jgi:Ribonuclease G/E
MTRRLVIAAGALETRGLLMDGDAPARLFFAADDDDPQPDDIRAGKVVRLARAQGGAFIDIGAARDAFLPAPKEGAPPVEGARGLFRVMRAASGEKGAVVAPAPNGAEPVERSPMQRIVDEAARFAPVSIAIDAPGLLADADYRPAAVLEARIEDAIADALTRVIPLPGGARLTIDETEALVAVDVDSGALEDAGRKAADETNRRAAAAVFRALALRNCGGRIVIDFLPSSGPRAKDALAALCREQDAALFPRRAGRLAPDGLFDLTAARRSQSVLERASERFDDGVASGRRLTLRWRLRRAVAALEDGLARAPRARLALAADRALHAAIMDAGVMEKVSGRFGARFSISARDMEGFAIHET